MSDIAAKYARVAVPRYTSYPTAPHFHAGVGESDYRHWLGETDPAEPISLYLHVPFCKQMCWYCGCNMKLSARYQPIADYTALLCREIELLADALPGRMTIVHLHWGGGTPTTLCPEDFQVVMDMVVRRFDIADQAELAVECDPRSLDQPMIDALGAAGFTRGSFGVQEFDPTVQAAINRVQPPGMVRSAVEGLRAAGLSAINFDLIYGLPHQTTDTLLETIALCADMAPDRIALFGYAHVPWRAKQQRMIDEAALPGAQARADQAAAAEAALIAAGYVAIGLDHFARPEDSLARAFRNGTLHRNFQGYTDDCAETLLSVGTTGIGRTARGYVQNESETRAWSRAVAAGRLPVVRGRALTADDALRGHVIERLMCDGAIDLADAGARYGAPDSWWAAERARLDAYAADGLLTRQGARITLTPAGNRLVRVVAAAFDAYLDHGQTQHSVAV